MLIVAAYVFTAILIVWPANWPVFLVLFTVPAALALVQLVRTNADAKSLNMSVLDRALSLQVRPAPEPGTRDSHHH